MYSIMFVLKGLSLISFESGIQTYRVIIFMYMHVDLNFNKNENHQGIIKMKII